MNMTQDDCLKKALLDTQERIRDFMSYSEHVENKELKACFRDFAETEGQQARKLRTFLPR